MFKLVFVILLVGNIFTLQAGSLKNDAVSAVVKKAFEQHFPGAMYATWESLKEDKLYAVRFVFQEVPQVAYYNTYGQVAGIVKAIPVYKLPPAVKNTAIDIFGMYEYASVEELLLDDEKQYLFITKRGKKNLLVKLNSYGHIEYTKFQ
jgi:hypothetical protein